MLVRITDVYRPSTRQKTPEGFLRASAVLTKPGVLEYDAKELGVGAQGDSVLLMQTADSVYHRDTISSARGAAITNGHPANGTISPSTWKDTVVGSIYGDPHKDDDGLKAEILIGDEATIRAIEDGKSELSIGKEISFEKAAGDAPYDYVTTGGIAINHVAVVSQGRAGADVRVLDSQQQTDKEGCMTAAEIQDAVKTALADTSSGGKKVDPDSLAAKVVDALKPLTEQVSKLADELFQRKEADRKEQVMAASKKLAADSKAEGIREERNRQAAIQDALQLIPEDQRASMIEKPVHEVLVAAVGDSIADAHDKSDDYLHGVIAMRRKQQVTDTPYQPGAQYQPPGVTYAAPTHRPNDRSAAWQEHQKRIDKAFADSGGIV